MPARVRLWAQLYAAIAWRGFRRHATYRAATLAGVFTNTIFGVIIAYTFLALWSQRPQLGGYGAAQALTFVWFAQALIMPVGLFGGTMLEWPERVRTGAVALDLLRPLDLQSWRLAEDLGRAGLHVLTRGVPSLLPGLVFFDLALPRRASTWALFALAVLLAVVVGFTLRYLLGLLAFWVVDIAGFATVLITSQLFLSGMVLPLTVFPDWLHAVTDALPFRCLVQLPLDVLLREDTGTAAAPLLAVQLAWALGLLGFGRLVTRRAVRVVVVQGG